MGYTNNCLIIKTGKFTKGDYSLIHRTVMTGIRHVYLQVSTRYKTLRMSHLSNYHYEEASEKFVFWPRTKLGCLLTAALVIHTQTNIRAAAIITSVRRNDAVSSVLEDYPAFRKPAVQYWRKWQVFISIQYPEFCESPVNFRVLARACGFEPHAVSSRARFSWTCLTRASFSNSVKLAQ